VWLSYHILFRYWNNKITLAGLPHSAIQGSQDMCSFPWLFAAYHGLLRLVAPRHPPYTYYSLDHIIVLSSILIFRSGSSCFFCQSRLTVGEDRLLTSRCEAFPLLASKIISFNLLTTTSKISLLCRRFRSLPLFCQISRASFRFSPVHLRQAFARRTSESSF
jgi:hypothetical protein